MRKQELIQVHGLLVVTREHLSDREDVAIPPDAFDAYDDYGVGPTAIDKRKADHAEAVDRLAEGLRTALRARRQTAHPPSAPSESDASSPHTS